MSQLKKWLVIILVVTSLLMTGAGGIMDMLGLSGMKLSSAHAWNDGMYLLVLAIFVMVAMK
jgi:hypothetical protein